MSITLERLAEKLNNLPPDRQQAFRDWLEGGAMALPSEVVKRVIRERGLTAYRLGKSTGVSVDAIQRFLNNETALRSAPLDKLCQELGLVLVEQQPTATKKNRKQ
ncbi:MAG: helix-turn-helix domain-containing protein [Candidatus Nanopelagicales bacterium]